MINIDEEDGLVVIYFLSLFLDNSDAFFKLYFRDCT